jgi:hypothetical protein
MQMSEVHGSAVTEFGVKGVAQGVVEEALPTIVCICLGGPLRGMKSGSRRTG